MLWGNQTVTFLNLFLVVLHFIIGKHISFSPGSSALRQEDSWTWGVGVRGLIKIELIPSRSSGSHSEGASF